MEDRKEQDEIRYVYKNRRAEMYGILRLLIDPSNEIGWGTPTEVMNKPRGDGGPSLREQLAPIPLTYDGEGRLEVLPKSKKDPTSEKPCLIDIIGCSPDEADALVLAVFGLEERKNRIVVRPLF